MVYGHLVARPGVRGHPLRDRHSDRNGASRLERHYRLVSELKGSDRRMLENRSQRKIEFRRDQLSSLDAWN